MDMRAAGLIANTIKEAGQEIAEAIRSMKSSTEEEIIRIYSGNKLEGIQIDGVEYRRYPPT